MSKTNKPTNSNTLAIVSVKPVKKKKKTSKNNRMKLSPNVQAPRAQSRAMTTVQEGIFRPKPRREFLTTIFGSTSNFQVVFSTEINPGNPLFSLWASNIAKCFESYRFRKLDFLYVPRTSTNSTGYICISPDTNPHDPIPTTEQQAFANEKAKDDAPWKEIRVSMTSRMLHKRSSYFCRKKGQLPIGADSDLYDVGNIRICVGGQADTSALGQLWVEYELEFETPEGNDLDPPTMLAFSNTNVTVDNPLGTISKHPGVNNLQSDNPIESITSDGIGSVVKFAKAFHGVASMVNRASSGISGLPACQGLDGAIVNIQEPANWNGNLNLTSATSSIINSLVKVAAGQSLRFSFPGGGSTGVSPTVSFSLMSCPL